MTNWEKAVMKPNDTIGDAIQRLNSDSLKIILVSDSQRRLFGTITDGDIRRALIKQSDYGMNSCLADIMCKNPITVVENCSRVSLLSLMKAKDIMQVPVLDMEGCLVGLHTLQDLLGYKESFDNPVFIMAGGFGKRLRPLTNNIPKPLLKVNGKPILEIILEKFVRAGFYSFYISIHYKAEMIKSYFGDGSLWGVKIHYVYENQPLGTAGALGFLPKKSIKYPLILMNADLLTNVDFEKMLDFHAEQGGVATMSVREYDFQVPYGVVRARGSRVSSIEEKPVHKFFVNAGIYVLNPELVFKVRKNSYLDMPTLLEQQVNHGGQVNMFPVHEYWLDIGHIEHFEKAQVDRQVFFQND